MDRRKDLRVDANIATTFYINDNNFYTNINNLSLSGACLKSPYYFNRNDQIQMQLFTNLQDYININGEIRHVKVIDYDKSDYEIGIKFLDLENEKREILEEIIVMNLFKKYSIENDDFYLNWMKLKNNINFDFYRAYFLSLSSQEKALKFETQIGHS